MVSAVFLIALALIVSCSSSKATRSGATPTGALPTIAVTQGSQTFPIAQAEELLGFSITLPTYVPEGLEAPSRVAVQVDAGQHYAAVLAYPSGSQTRSANEIIVMFLEESKRKLEQNVVQSERIGVGERVVYVTNESAGYLELAWADRGLSYYLDIGSNATEASDSLRAEGLKVIESMRS